MINKKNYFRDGYISPIDILSPEETLTHRKELETAEKKIGSLHYKTKVHTILKSPYELAINKKVLNIVEDLIGPNILLYNVTYIIKEPNTSSHVSWHQDLTYWGFNSDNVVSMWLALSEANELSGAMEIIPGSHNLGMFDHEKTNDKSNVLLQGQTVKDVNNENSVLCALKPGQASFHHGWVLHKSGLNNSIDRRIGLNVQYISTDVKQLKIENDSAFCVKGKDLYNNFNVDVPAKSNLDPLALSLFNDLDKNYKDLQKIANKV
tara:strand:+ start:908 stop:1699 length:792 start_codon:yes stop_codon:yes gene_type:complete